MTNNQSIESVLVTGCNRGLGLQFVKELLALQPKYVIATYRQPDSATQLQQLKQLHSNLYILQLDVTKFDQFEHFVHQVDQIVGSDGLQMLINNAGIYHRNTLDSVTPEDMLADYETNVVAPLHLTRLLRPIMARWAKQRDHPLATVVNISSDKGSISQEFGGRYSYASSKAALNQITRCLSIDLTEDRIQVVSVHPGWVLTDMGGTNAQLTPEHSIPQVVKLITGQTDTKLNGQFLNYDATKLSW